MHYRRLGKSGIKVSEISLGSWVTFGEQISDVAAVELTRSAYEAGINFFDCADAYAKGRAEEVLGKAVAGLPRETLIISSKVFFPTMDGVNGRGLSRKHITESIHASLKRLNLDYVDIYFCHRHDPDTTVEEVVQTMDILVRQGKVLYWGTSEWDAFRLSQAFSFARANGLILPAVEQPRYSLMQRQRVELDIADLVQEYGLGLTTFSPLYYGILSGKYNQGIPEGSRATLADMAWVKDRITPPVITQVKELTAIAEGLGATTAQLAIAWILRRKQVSSVITGATRLEQLDENLGAADLVERLDDGTLERVDALFPLSHD
jgi:voltage-dependent potassium channel beta subunit